MARKISERRLNRLLELNEKLVLENDFSKRVKIISDTIKDILKVDRCTIFLYDKDCKSMWSVYIDGVSYIEVPYNKGVVGEVFKTKKIVIVNDMKKNKKFDNLVDMGSGYTTNSLLALPILGYDGNILGVMQLINKIDGDSDFSQEDEKILNYVIGHISAYLEIMT